MFARNLLSLSAAIVLLGCVHSRGAVLTLSDLSSDATSASLLDGTLEFVVSASTLTLTVTNATAAPDAFEISEIYFNASDDVASLALTSPSSGWDLVTDDKADGFGTFDFGLIGQKGVPRVGVITILPGDSHIFQFSITPAAGALVTDIDFVSILSTTPPGDHPSTAAAKFIRGPGEDSAFGATAAVIPSPSAAAAGFALLLCAALFRRRLHVSL